MSRLLCLAMLLFVLVADAATAQAEPRFDIDVEIQSPPEQLNERTTYEVPVDVTLICRQISPFLIHNVNFKHEVNLTTAGAEPLKIRYQKSFMRPFSPEWCLDGTEISYDFEISFKVPALYPALTPVGLMVNVRAENATGEDTAYWNTTVAYEGEVDFDGPGHRHWSKAPEQTTRRFALSNNGNGAIKGLVTLAPDAPEGVHMDAFEFGPVPAGMRTGYEFILYTGNLSQGEYAVRYQVETWLSDHPEYRLPNQTMRHYVMIGQDYEGLYVEGPMPVAPFLLIVVAAMILAQRSRRSGLLGPHRKTHRRK